MTKEPLDLIEIGEALSKNPALFNHLDSFLLHLDVNVFEFKKYLSSLSGQNPEDWQKAHVMCYFFNSVTTIHGAQTKIQDDIINFWNTAFHKALEERSLESKFVEILFNSPYQMPGVSGNSLVLPLSGLELTELDFRRLSNITKREPQLSETGVPVKTLLDLLPHFASVIIDIDLKNVDVDQELLQILKLIKPKELHLSVKNGVSLFAKFPDESLSQVESLFFASFNRVEIPNSIFPNFFSKFKNLKTLDLNGAIMSSQAIVNIPENILKNVTTLSLGGEVNDEMMELLLAKTHALTHLSINNLFSALTKFPQLLRQLEELSIWGQLDEQLITNILTETKNLKTLSLSFYETEWSQDGNYFKFLPVDTLIKLETLRVNGSGNGGTISFIESRLFEILKRTKNLQKLQLIYLHELLRDSFLSLPDDTFKQLRELAIEKTIIDESVVSQIFNQANSIEKLWLKNGDYFDEATFSTLNQKVFPQLKSIYLNSTNTSKVTLAQLLSKCTHLEEINTDIYGATEYYIRSFPSAKAASIQHQITPYQRRL